MKVAEGVVPELEALDVQLNGSLSLEASQVPAAGKTRQLTGCRRAGFDAKRPRAPFPKFARHVAACPTGSAQAGSDRQVRIAQAGLFEREAGLDAF